MVALGLDAAGEELIQAITQADAVSICVNLLHHHATVAHGDVPWIDAESAAMLLYVIHPLQPAEDLQHYSDEVIKDLAALLSTSSSIERHIPLLLYRILSTLVDFARRLSTTPASRAALSFAQEHGYEPETLLELALALSLADGAQRVSAAALEDVVQKCTVHFFRASHRIFGNGAAENSKENAKDVAVLSLISLLIAASTLDISEKIVHAIRARSFDALFSACAHLLSFRTSCSEVEVYIDVAQMSSCAKMLFGAAPELLDTRVRAALSSLLDDNRRGGSLCACPSEAAEAND
jgi:hypothetical protein